MFVIVFLRQIPKISNELLYTFKLFFIYIAKFPFLMIVSICTLINYLRLFYHKNPTVGFQV